MAVSWASAAVVLVSLGALVLLAGGRRRRRRGPTQHDLDPTLKKNQIRIATQKKAFRREDLPPEYLASLQRRDIVELPMGAPRPEPPATPPLSADASDAWLPDHLKAGGKKLRKKA